MRCVWVAALVPVLAGVCPEARGAAHNTPPQTPVILEPAADSHRSFDPGDVHMAAGPFSDPDAGDVLSCSDWEIQEASSNTTVWHARCVTGPSAVHIHLGDGTFTTPEERLRSSSSYRLRVRFRDSSGDSDTEWSPWALREFTTSAILNGVHGRCASSPHRRSRRLARCRLPTSSRPLVRCCATTAEALSSCPRAPPSLS
jgi:hypothetical protein